MTPLHKCQKWGEFDELLHLSRDAGSIWRKGNNSKALACPPKAAEEQGSRGFLIGQAGTAQRQVPGREQQIKPGII